VDHPRRCSQGATGCSMRRTPARRFVSPWDSSRRSASQCSRGTRRSGAVAPSRHRAASRARGGPRGARSGPPCAGRGRGRRLHGASVRTVASAR
jgi:hypothetical protein